MPFQAPANDNTPSMAWIARKMSTMAANDNRASIEPHGILLVEFTDGHGRGAVMYPIVIEGPAADDVIGRIDGSPLGQTQATVDHPETGHPVTVTAMREDIIARAGKAVTS